MSVLFRIAEFALLLAISTGQNRAEASSSIDPTPLSNTVAVRGRRKISSTPQAIHYSSQYNRSGRLLKNNDTVRHPNAPISPPVLPGLPFTTYPSNQPTR